MYKYHFLLWRRANTRNVSQHTLYGAQRIHSINLTWIHSMFYPYADSDLLSVVSVTCTSRWLVVFYYYNYYRSERDLYHIHFTSLLWLIYRYHKIKVDKSKLLKLLGIKRSLFDQLCQNMDKLVPSLEGWSDQ